MERLPFLASHGPRREAEKSGHGFVGANAAKPRLPQPPILHRVNNQMLRIIPPLITIFFTDYLHRWVFNWLKNRVLDKIPEARDMFYFLKDKMDSPQNSHKLKTHALVVFKLVGWCAICFYHPLLISVPNWLTNSFFRSCRADMQFSNSTSREWWYCPPRGCLKKARIHSFGEKC